MVIYEWDVETHADGDTEAHEDGEVLDHNHFERFADAVAFSKSDPPDGCRYAIVLVRDDDDRRSWAYLETGLLPVYFSDADGSEYKMVPKRFARLEA